MGIVLMIDDDERLLTTYASIASVNAVEFFTAKTWDEGLAEFHAIDPDLAIVDYNLEGSKLGLQLLAELRAFRPTTRLILLSGYITSADASEVEALGIADRALVKGAPGTAEELTAEIIAAGSVDRDAPIDWTDVAKGYANYEALDTQRLDRLDLILRGKVRPDE